MDKNILAILRRFFLLNWPYDGEMEMGVLDVPPTGLRNFVELVEVF